MRMHIPSHATLLTFCLSLAAATASAGGAPLAPPGSPAPPAPADSAATAANPPDIDEAAARPGMEAAQHSEDVAQRSEEVAQRSAEATRRREDALRAQMKVARRRLEVAAQQLAALSAQMYGPMMQHVEAFGPSHALIGVQLDDSSGDAGARVREVSPGGPAEQAGVRAGDLIMAVNGTSVRGHEPAARVVELLHDVKPGDKVDLEVSRDGKTRECAVTARPEGDEFFIARQLPDLPALPEVRALAPWGGGPTIIRGPVADMELARLTPGLGRYFGTDSGVLVVRAPPAGGLGLQDGDVILSIGGREPIDSSHVIRILGSYDPGEKITLQVLRLHHKIEVATTLPAEPQASGRVFEVPKRVVVQPGPLLRLRRGDRTY